MSVLYECGERGSVLVQVESLPYRGPFPATLSAPTGIGERALCSRASCRLQRVLAIPGVDSVTAVAPGVVRIEHSILGREGEDERIDLISGVVQLLEAP